jgi:hypothetical protein
MSTEIKYPDTLYMGREHEQADHAARRRAVTSLDNIIEQADILRRRLIEGQLGIDGSYGRAILESSARLPEHLSALEILERVREWHAADQAEIEQGEPGWIPAAEAAPGQPQNGQ